MENNPLLAALQDELKRQGALDNYLFDVSISDFKAHILDLLGKQREKCAEDVEIDHSSYYVKISILNAKLIETQNKQ